MQSPARVGPPAISSLPPRTTKLPPARAPKDSGGPADQTSAEGSYSSLLPRMSLPPSKPPAAITRPLERSPMLKERRQTVIAEAALQDPVAES